MLLNSNLKALYDTIAELEKLDATDMLLTANPAAEYDIHTVTITNESKKVYIELWIAPLNASAMSYSIEEGYLNRFSFNGNAELFAKEIYEELINPSFS